MSASNIIIQRTDLHRAFPDSIKNPLSISERHSLGLDCTDYNGRDDDREPTVPPTHTGASQHGKADQLMSAPPAMTTTRDLNQMDLKREEQRLLTFNNANWNVPFLNTSKLAQIGFYYMGIQDVVKCFFCKVEIGKWEAEDDCFAEHMRWSPSCPLLRRQQTDNVPIDADELNQILPPITYDTCGPIGGVVIRRNAYPERSFTPSESGGEYQSGTGSTRSVGSTVSTPTSSSEDETGSPTLTLAMPMFASPSRSADNFLPAASAGMPPPPSTNQRYAGIPGPATSYFNNTFTNLEIEANRLKTFKEWPIQLKMKPAELSDAGFFYTGVGDHVQCFSCGGGLKNWENNDVAWEQHALWYGNCEYLKLYKGPKYIEAVKEMHRRAEEQQSRAEARGETASEGEEEETVESTEDDEEGEQAQAKRSTRPAPIVIQAGTREGDAIPSTSRSVAVGAQDGELRKTAPRRRRRVPKNCDSHPESEINSPEAILAAKSAKPSEVPEAKLCKICYECEFNTAFLPCGHVVACGKCASAVTLCPMCREPFENVTRIYFS